MFMGGAHLESANASQPAIAFLFVLRERSIPFSFNKNISAYLIIPRRTIFLHIAFVNRRFHTLGVLTRLSSILPRGLRNPHGTFPLHASLLCILCFCILVMTESIDTRRLSSASGTHAQNLSQTRVKVCFFAAMFCHRLLYRQTVWHAKTL